MQDKQLDNTFNAIRNLPVEIEFSGIEQFVLAQPPAIFTPSNFTWLNFKNILIMTTSGSLIGVLLMLNQAGPVKTTQPLSAPQIELTKQEIVLPPKQDIPQDPGRTSVLPAERPKQAEVADLPANATIAPVVKAGPVPALAEPADLPATWSTDVPPPAPEPAAPDENYVTEALVPVAGCNPSHAFPCHCKCNDGNNVTCTFKEKLLDDEIIDDSEVFSFRIDSKEFIVNGKAQPANVYKKYARIYRELTDHKLTEGSYMTVKIEKGNCSISINYNESE